MPKAFIETSTGTKISVEGSTDEIADIVAHIKSREQGFVTKHESVEKKLKRSSNKPKGLVAFIMDLKASGFFDKPRKIADVKEALAEQAHHYPIQSISTSLIRRVKKAELGRVRDGKDWVYVKR